MHIKIINNLALRKDIDGIYRVSYRNFGERVTLEEFRSQESAEKFMRETTDFVDRRPQPSQSAK